MKLLRAISVSLLLVLLAVPGVFAAWQYCHTPPAPLNVLIPKNMSAFEEYKGVCITSVEVVSTSGASVTDSDFAIPAVHKSTVKPNRNGGSVTYKIKLYNNTDVNYWYIEYDHPTELGQNALVNASQGITITMKDHLSDTAATFDSNDWIPPQTERDVYVTYTYGANAQASCTTSISFRFNVKIDSVQDEFLAILNGTVSKDPYLTLVEIFNSLYAASGKTAISTASHPKVFEDLFGDLKVNIDGEEKTAAVVIRRDNLDNDTVSGDDYSGSGPKGCEYTLYITVESPSPGESATVYAISYSNSASGMGDNWDQVGELYEGTAPVNQDGSIDYENWRASHKVYEIADGISYTVGAPNGDQYDIMNTMEQLISAVDQNIFNEIDNANIFKKVYDIIKNYPNSTDPAVVGLKKAFDDAAIFYRNLNNGQEFKVVRDKYTRAEIIHALSNIQKALDYYYQTEH